MPGPIWKLSSARAKRHFTVWAACAVFLSCIDNGSFIDPGEPRSHVPLARYNGLAFSKVDSSITNERILGLDSPKIALIWQFIGPKQFTFSNSGGVIKEANIPFRFRVELMNPPDEEILDAPDLALGMFWLYNDADGNGKFDRLLHPKMLELHEIVDRMHGECLAAMDSLLAVAEAKPVRVDVDETYYLGKYGTIVRMRDGSPDTIWTGRGPQDGERVVWQSVMNALFLVLHHPNRWERFFSLRKRSNNNFRIQKPAAGYALALEFPYERKLFPLPGKEAEFDRRVRIATEKWFVFGARYESMIRNAREKGWTDFPYDGFGEAGADWVAGRTREYFVLYIRNQAGMDEMVDAERASSFSVTGKEKLRLGYNLVWCGDQYECRVMSPEESIGIEYGMSDAFFNPPSTPLVFPLANPVAGEVPEGTLESLAGAYRFQPLHSVCITADREGIWASIPNAGMYRLVPADSLRFFAPAVNLQLEIVRTAGRTEKLLIYSQGNRFVATVDSSLSIPATIASKMEALSSRNPVSLPPEAIAGFSGEYDFGGDTLRVGASPSGDSLRIAVPGMLPHYYMAASESVFYSRDSDCRIVFVRDDAGRQIHLTLERHDSLIWCPSFAHAPRTGRELFPGIAEPDSQVSASEGRRPDTYVGLDGKGRYPSSSDGRFLGAGDGWVAALEPSLPGDSISLGRGGKAIVFRMDGLEGRAGGLDFRLSRDPRGGKGRVRFRLTGGTDPSGAGRILADDFWVDFPEDTVSVSVQAWPVEGDPFFVRLERLATADPAPPVAFDSYHLRVSRGAYADP